MNKIMKMSEKILSHALEIISLLTGQVSLLHHLSKSLTVIEKKDKKLTEDILNHTLEILYLLTGEEYTISKKKNSPHNRNHQLIGECDVVRHKETPTENCHPRRTLGMPATKSSGLQDENMDAVSEEGCDEIDEKEILKVTIHSDLCAGLPDENVYSVSINEEGKYERDGNDILHPDPCAESSSVNSDLLKQEEELKSRDQQQFKEEEIPVNIIKVT